MNALLKKRSSKSLEARVAARADFARGRVNGPTVAGGERGLRLRKELLLAG